MVWAVVLGHVALGAAASVALPGSTEGAVAGPLGTLAVVAVSAVALLALLLRVRVSTGNERRPWLLLAAACPGLVVWVALGGPGAAGGADLPAHLALTAVVAAALWLLPAPRDTSRGALRTGLDAAAAGLALAVPAAELVLPGRLGGAMSALSSALHPLADVLLATVAIAVVSRSRRTGGLPVRPMVAMTLGTVLFCLADLLQRDGAARPTVLALLCIGVTLWGFAAWLPGDGAETDVEMLWRERIAVLVPLGPVSAAALLLLASSLLHQPVGPAALTCSVLLGGTLVTGGVLARLDSLSTERLLDELVLKRTVSIGSREKWFRALVQNSSDVITVVDVRGVIRYLTPSVTQILGHDPGQLVGTKMTSLLRPGDGRRLEAALASAARSPGRPVTLEFPVWGSSGVWCDTETTVTSLVHDPDIRGLVLNTRDVSERRRLEEQLTQQAYSDGLTGLANRSLFRSKVDASLRLAPCPGEVAVLYLDLDGFKAVNDAQGHHVGDQVLGIVAQRLSGAVRPGDVVARLGGDEFAILVTGRDAEAGAVRAAERVRRALAAPFVLDGRELLLGASTGIAVSDSGDETADQLLRNADLAMYRAKSRRDQSFVRFEAEMHDAVLARMKAESDLRQAVANGDLVLYFQPVVELDTGRIVGVEALVRWRHHERGIISPADFIDLAEETGLVNEIGRWALEESCIQGVRWQRYAPPGDHFKVAVNVSVRQLDSALPLQVRDVLAATGLPGPALTLEMTESVLMERTEEVVELLDQMKTLGLRVAVDDFGTGYSSLSYLSRFPVDILKIDQSFVQNLGGARGQSALVHTIVRLGESLQLDTVAEGIETPAQRDALTAMGCRFGQGYLFARPLPVDEVDALLAQQAAAQGADTSAPAELTAS